MLKDHEHLHGLRELSIKLEKLAGKTAPRKLRNVFSKSLTPTKRKMKASAPKGSEPHKTYRNRTVAPGFLSRSIRSRSRIKQGRLYVEVGVRAEAFYGVQFIDQGPFYVTDRKDKPIQPYVLRRTQWFERTFRSERAAIERRIVSILKQDIERLKR